MVITVLLTSFAYLPQRPKFNLNFSFGNAAFQLPTVVTCINQNRSFEFSVMSVIMCRKLKYPLNNNACYYFSHLANTKSRVRSSNQNLDVIYKEFHLPTLMNNSISNNKGENVVKDTDKQNNNNEDIVYNPCGVQMISKSLHQQTFKNSSKRNKVGKEVLAKIEKHLASHDLWGRIAPVLPNIDLKLPPLCGNNLDEHFRNAAEKQSQVYRDSLMQLISRPVPNIPKVWQFYPGWTQYDEEGNFRSVDYPEEDAYVFDIEVCVTEGHLPTLATAVSNTHWYSWCSEQLYYQKVF